MSVDNNMMSGFYEGIWIAIKMYMASSMFPVVVIFVILSIILQWKKPVIKGKYGEWVVKSKLQKLGDAYTVYHDVYIPNGERGLTQVDHIVTSVHGVFVIETKHYSGWIFGDEYKPYWTQVIYKKKTKMHNPIRQNYGHVQALLTYIGQEEMKDVHSIIAFSPNSTFKFKKGFTSAHVIQFPELLTTIKQYKEQRISEAAVKGINEKLKGLLVEDKSERKHLKAAHMQSVRKAKGAKQTHRIQASLMSKVTKEVAPTTCPKCEGQLTIKAGRYGKFYGCSNYPDCRFTENLNTKQRSVIKEFKPVKRSKYRS
ncbi:NERD domain-containing protein [Sporosarcina luteola]|uniref:NERD domain-containing protein n=1 Tax=Sporosarcina luteola TaxID=582850 RepID=UPI00204021BD|nr:NERD domain-containing protein [Sporosarcina luteola]MCM3745130.1 NERD domain-containing protein [Sporosarcina luteola]